MLHPFDPYVLFRNAVERWPDRPALRIGDQEWTYMELDSAANAIAGWCDQNTPAGSRIAIHGKKDLLAYAAILGVLQAGRSYVPLHPDHPPARWRNVIDQAACSAIIAGPVVAKEMASVAALPLLTNVPEVGPQVQRGGAEAYVMFTSGSTGGPKGVPVSRTNVAAYLEQLIHRYTPAPEERFSQLFALSFDLSVHDLFVCWGAGACLCVPPTESALQLPAYVQAERITMWFSVPSLAAMLHRMRALRPGVFDHIKHSFFCGEALGWDTVHAWQIATANAPVTNLYGPTEATIAITAFEVTASDERMTGVVPIGAAIGENKVRIEVASAEGELWLSGPQVTVGYVERPAETAKAFVKQPGSEVLWYRTGDRVRMDAEGCLHFLGRLDDQVKIGGHRVEPAEVDALLGPLVPHGNVLTIPMDLHGSMRLVTFIDVALDTTPLMAFLHKELPAYMVPERIIQVDGFPSTAHGKVDRKALIDIATNG